MTHSVAQNDAKVKKTYYNYFYDKQYPGKWS